MKKYPGILLLTITLFAAFSFQTNPAAKKKKIDFKGSTFLAGGLAGNGKISAKEFESLMKQPLVSKDSQGVLHAVASYSFTYAERGAYEDSTGTLRIMTDYYTAESENGKLPEYYVNSLKERIKYGDTVYYFDVMASVADTGAARYHSLPLKLILTK
ncbi:hypothetical protein F0919_16860 [Taibaiella lutea]|uniref:Uncharacterized protein n=1 Tax=Taibaiella lutea TaxID=2608001 RepID=A0A5M6CB92_9BACT|nr:hypothetical protein [Taibaiella lutea]KAA5532458.1 hypothetical protein F0919_16860 [Taibaiella lutea]